MQNLHAMKKAKYQSGRVLNALFEFSETIETQMEVLGNHLRFLAFEGYPNESHSSSNIIIKTRTKPLERGMVLDY